MNALADVIHFFANEFTGLRGRGFALSLVAFGASNSFLFGHQSSCETVIRGQFVIWGGAILSGVCLSEKIRKDFATEDTEKPKRRGIPHFVRNNENTNQD